jgi:branched-chain amino acid transport system substrate-binding protein
MLRSVLSRSLIAATLLSLPLVWGEVAEAAVPCPIRLGSVRPTSGGMASIGQSMVEGLAMGFDAVKAQGGIGGCKDIEITAYDSQSIPANAATVTRRLVNQDQVPLIISTPISVEVLAMMEVTENAGIPLYVPSAASAKVTNQGFKWVWRQSAVDTMSARAMAAYIIHDLKWKKLGAVYENSDFGKPTWLNVLKPALQQGGVTITGEEAINAGDSDLSSQLLHVKDSGADGVLFWGHAKEGALLLGENQQLKINIPIAGSTGLVYPEFIRLLPADVQDKTDMVAVTQFISSTDDPAQKKWIDAYRARFNREPDATSIDAYDAVFVLKQAIERAGSMDAEALQKAFNATDYKGVGGPISFDSTGQAQRQVEIVRLTPKSGPGFKVIKVFASDKS